MAESEEQQLLVRHRALKHQREVLRVRREQLEQGLKASRKELRRVAEAEARQREQHLAMMEHARELDTGIFKLRQRKKRLTTSATPPSDLDALLDVARNERSNPRAHARAGWVCACRPHLAPLLPPLWASTLNRRLRSQQAVRAHVTSCMLYMCNIHHPSATV